MERVFKGPGDQISLETKGILTNQWGFLRSLCSIPSSSSVVVSMTNDLPTTWFHTIAVYSMKNSNDPSTTIFLHFKTDDVNNENTSESKIFKVQRGKHPIFFYTNKKVTELKLWGVEEWWTPTFTTYHLEDALNGSKEDKVCIYNLTSITGVGIDCPAGLINLPDCAEFSSTLRYCSKCNPGLTLTISWPLNNYPTFNCGTTVNCQADEFRGADQNCYKCDSISGGKPGCHTCSFTGGTFSCLSCKADFTTQLSNTNVPCKKICITTEGISLDGKSCLPCIDIDPECIECEDYTALCTTCNSGFTLHQN
jgi:hypothetical protein